MNKNRWWWLLLITTCWTGAGFAMFGTGQDVSHLPAHTPTKPTRIVSTAPSLTEILFALGLENQIVGVTIFSDYPQAATQKPKVGTFWQPNIEAIIAAKPDLVVTLGFSQQRNLANRLKRLGYRTLTIDLQTVTDLFDTIKILGPATATQPEATQLMHSLRRKLDELSALTAAENKPKVLWVVQRQPLRVAGTDTFVNEMIELAGGTNAIGKTVHKYPPVGAEQIYTCGADVIIEPSMNRANSANHYDAALRYWSRFENLPAVRDQRIYVIDGDIVSRLGPRLYEAAETIARCVRPEVFEKSNP